MSEVDEQAAAPEQAAEEVEASAPEASAEESATTEEAPQKSWQERIDEVLERNSKAQADQTAEAEEELLEEQPEKKVAWDDVIAKQPSDVQQLMRQLRAESTRKFQEASRLTKQAEAERAALFDSPMFQKLQTMASTDAQIDPFDPKSIDSFIEKKVAERLQAVLQPAQAAHRKAEAQHRYEQFMSSHPDLQSNRGLQHQVAAELRNNESMTLEQAYLVVRGRSALQDQRKSDERRAAERRAAKAAALKVSAPPSRVSVKGRVEAEGLSAWEIYQRLDRLQKTS
tara:strand:+ start:3206 stop:4057 length:852 start_codon:yes stop_codon:yes gene_type:complete